MDFLCVCIRVPKSGSTSLANMLNVAFAARRTFYMPHTLNLDAAISRFQEARFARTRWRNLLKRYHTFSLQKAFDIIASRASDGDLINGGHIVCFPFPQSGTATSHKKHWFYFLQPRFSQPVFLYRLCKNRENRKNPSSFFLQIFVEIFRLLCKLQNKTPLLEYKLIVEIKQSTKLPMRN